MQPQSVRFDSCLTYALPLRERDYFDWKCRLAIVFVLSLRMVTLPQKILLELVVVTPQVFYYQLVFSVMRDLCW